jgi:hypothetical protein
MRFFRDEAFLEERRQARSGARHVRSDLSRLLDRQADAAEAAADYKEQQSGKYSSSRLPRRGAAPGMRAVLGAQALLLTRRADAVLE